MAPRADAAISRGSPDDSYPDMDSSPDPLNASINSHNTRVRKGTRASKPVLVSSSPSKHNRRRSTLEQGVDLSSPTKSLIMNTGRPGGMSPWRIKVTVQAEPGSSDTENVASPTVKRMERKTTTTVPLKDADASSPVKRRGRPRKSETSTSATPKRTGTPVGKKPRSRPRKSNVPASDASIAPQPTDASPKKRRGRPRKSILPEAQPEVQHEQEAQNDQTVDANATALETAPKSTPQMEVPVLQTTPGALDETSQPNPSLQGTKLTSQAGQAKGVHRPPLTEAEEPINSSTPPETLSKRLRSRKGTPHSKAVVPRPDSSDEDGAIDTPSATDEEAPVAESCNSGSHPLEGTIDLQAQLGALEEDDHNDDGCDDVTNYALDEGVTRMPNDTTVFESENFSMISIDSLPSSGGLSSPDNQLSISTPAADNVEMSLDQSYLNIPLMHTSTARKSPRHAANPYTVPLQTTTASPPVRPSPQAPRERQQTPAMDMRSPSNPPALEPAHFPPSEVETPRIGRVMKAGVALQGVLDPNRITPTAAQERRDSLDDLFRGFSEGTRRDLQAGLRMGEHLAMEENGHTNHQSAASFPSPVKPSTSKTQADDLFSPHGKQRKSRCLLTPEDAEDYELPLPPPPTEDTGVNYPSLRVNERETYLVSPASSDNEMSWQANDPPVRAESSNAPSMVTAINQQGDEIRGTEIYVEARNTKDRRTVTTTKDQGDAITGTDIYVVASENDNAYSDIWQEEASRSSSLHAEDEAVRVPQKEKTPQLQDLFADGQIKPARGKLPRTWRRRSSSDFYYSDEPEEAAQQLMPSSSEEPDQSTARQVDKGKERMAEPSIPEERYVGGEFSEASDDTGMFFQSNLPTNYRSASSKKRKSESLNNSLLLDVGQSLLPESSPNPALRTQVDARSGKRSSPSLKAAPTPRAKVFHKDTIETPENSVLLDDGSSLLPESSSGPLVRTPLSAMPNPFRNPPPHFGALYSSPVKSSPLRQELRASVSEGSFSRGESVEESSLPVSSPFHTNVNITAASIASDEQQFRQEMEAATDSSIRYLRQEADAHADAYESQYRTLNEIEEVTEQSQSARTMALMPSSPPVMISQRQEESEKLDHSLLLDDGQTFPIELSQSIDESILRPTREYSPLFDDKRKTSSSKQTKRPTHKTVEKPTITITPPVGEAPVSGSGLFSRLSSTIWGALGAPVPPPIHPVTAKLDPLPKVEPWTKTHYKTLDRLFQLHKRKPTLFDPFSPSTTSDVNNALLTHFLNTQKHRFVGARYCCWGYSVIMTESLVVLCAVYMQLLTLKDIAEYERTSQKQIEMGDCNPGVSGKVIDGTEIVRRLASVVMGEDLRRDEKLGIEIVREGSMNIEWPN